MIDSSVTEGVTYIPDQHLKGHSEYVQSELLCSLDCWENFVLVAVAVSIYKNLIQWSDGNFSYTQLLIL